MIVRIERLPYTYEERLYDLSDGSLLIDEPIGRLKDGRDVYSAEALLTDIEMWEPGQIVSIIVTGFTHRDFVDEVEP